MDYQAIIDKYYPEDDELKRLLLKHSRQVADRCLLICDRHPELHIDREFVEEAAMLHDIGMCRTDAPGIHCYGTEPYILHGILGRKMLDGMGLFRHGRVCERHTGAGITAAEIIAQHLPIDPPRDLLPESLEEKVVCYADKFFSKSRIDEEPKTLERARQLLAKFGGDTLQRFEELVALFGDPAEL